MTGALALVLLVPTAAGARASLVPSRSALSRQVQAARGHDYTYLRNDQQVRSFVSQGLLVRLPGNRDYEVKRGVRFPHARPEVKVFIERLSQQYRRACGDKLVVTSLVRPKSRQPRNASPHSVHPTGMALDLRISNRRRCRGWLEDALLGLESRGVLEAARERRPPHYHVVLFPREYTRYVKSTLGQDHPLLAPAKEAYRVRSGDTLWRIAERHGLSVNALRRLNGLRSNLIKPGQVLKVSG